MMHNIFWAQNESTDVPNTVIDHNGDLYSTEFSDTDGYQLFQQLLGIEEASKLIFQNDNLYIKQHTSGGYFISSNFLEKDNSNRRMGFMFFSLELESQMIISDLNFYGNILNRTFSKEDLQHIENNIQIKQNNNLKLIVVLSSIALLLLLIYILWEIQN